MSAEVAIIGICTTLVALVVWIVKTQSSVNTKLQEKYEGLAERSIKAIENNNILAGNNNEILKEIKRVMENKG